MLLGMLCVNKIYMLMVKLIRDVVPRKIGFGRDFLLDLLNDKNESFIFIDQNKYNSKII